MEAHIISIWQCQCYPHLLYYDFHKVVYGPKWLDDQMNTRYPETYEVDFANTERLKKSPIIYMQNLLNTDWIIVSCNSELVCSIPAP